jgi:hypothetical protein
MTKKNKNTAGMLTLLAGAGLIGLGSFLGQNHAVLSKAAHICLECIGIG